MLFKSSHLFNSRFGESKLVILCYHSIDNSNSYISNTPKQLEEHLSFLIDRGYRFASLAKLATHLMRYSNGNEPRLASITFDDGYRNNVEVALPILEQYKCPATFFITTGWVGSRLGRYFSELPDLPLMARKDWEVLARHPLVTLGAHSHTHPRLAQLAPEDVENELITCKHVLEEVTRYPITSVAYPHGSVSPMVVSVARRIGFQTGCTIQPRFTGNVPEPFLLPRVRVRSGTTPRQLSMQVSAPWRWALYRRWLTLTKGAMR